MGEISQVSIKFANNLAEKKTKRLMFGIPELEKKTFRNDFINNVVVSGSYNNNRSCAEHRQALKERYTDLLPIQADMPQQQYRIDFDVKTNQTSVKANVDEKERQVVLRSRNVQSELTLNNNEFHYRESGQAYGTSATFNEHVAPVLGFLEESGVTSLNRLKLRKVNVIGFEQKAAEPSQKVFTWQPAANLISEKLNVQYQAMMGVMPFAKHHVSTLQFADGDYVLTIKYGFNVLEKKADDSSVKGQVIIDLEIARQSAVNTTDGLGELRIMHKELYNAFCWCISGEFVNLLNG